LSSKSPAQTPKQRTLSKLVLNFFYNVIHVIDQMQDSEMLQLAISESARLLPYVITSRKVIKQYLKVRLFYARLRLAR
jgi:nucleolar complex protein 2